MYITRGSTSLGLGVLLLGTIGTGLASRRHTQDRPIASRAVSAASRADSTCDQRAIGCPYDLIVDSLDDNGLPLNPTWRGMRAGGRPSIWDCFNYDPEQCTSPSEQWAWWADFTSWKCPDTPFEYVPWPGHFNRTFATFTGYLYWGDHSGDDDDYNIELASWDPRGPGLTAEDSNTLHMEFDSDETTQHFDQGWWNDFRHASDGGHASGSKWDRLLWKPAVAFGVFGLDCAHSCGAELHPVFGLAIHTKDDPSDDVWEIMVRNWGDEGYCSHGAELFQQRDIRFRLPRVNAGDVEITGGEFWTRKSAPGSGPWLDRVVTGQGAVFGFSLPVPVARQSGGDDTKWSWVFGELHLRWRVTGAQVAASFPVRSLTNVERAEASRVLVENMSRRQRSAYDRLLSEAPVGHAAFATVPIPRSFWNRRKQGQPPRQAAPAPLISDYPRRDSLDAYRRRSLRTVYGGHIPGLDDTTAADRRKIMRAPRPSRDDTLRARRNAAPHDST